MVEKGSRRRTVIPRPPLRAALTDLVRSLPGDAAYLFARGPTLTRAPHPRSVRRALRGLCQQAGIRPVPPHSFRAFLVNFGMHRGATLEDMAGYLNHGSAVTTGRFYWTADDALLQTVNALFDGEGEAELAATQAEGRGAGGMSPPRPCARSGGCVRGCRRRPFVRRPPGSVRWTLSSTSCCGTDKGGRAGGAETCTCWRTFWMRTPS